MSNTPFLAISTDEMKKLPDIELRKGDEIKCPACKKKHVLKAGKDDKGKVDDFLLFYNCKEKTYLAAISGRSIMNRKIGSSGEI